MSNGSLEKLELDALVVRFRDLALAQDRAIESDSHRNYNLLYRQMGEVKAALERRLGDQRRLLEGLYVHPNPQVRLQAALATKDLLPERARSVLQAISDRLEYPQAVDARFALRSLDRLKIRQR